MIRRAGQAKRPARDPAVVRRGGAPLPRGALLLGGLYALACGPGTPAGPLELKLGHVGAPGSLYAIVADEYAARVEAAIGDRARIQVFGSSQLGGDELLLQKIKLGTVDFALPSTVMSSEVDAFGLFEMPYLVDDREHMRAIEEEVVWPDLVPAAAEDGYRILAVWENGFRHVTNNARPITVPADLAGIKLRTPRGVWRVKLFQALGANPTPMALSEVFIGLQTGVIDGQENPLAQIWASKLYEVQAFLSLTAHVYTPAYVVVSPGRFGALPEAVRTVLEEEARAAQAFVHETAARLDAELLAGIRESGTAVNEPDRAAFAAASRAVYEEFSSSVPGAAQMIERALAAGGR